MSDAVEDPTHYTVTLHLPEPTTIEVGALGPMSFSAGDWVYIGRATRGFDARLERHRRRAGPDKTLRWHVDYLREAARWVEARVFDGVEECALAERVASLEGARRPEDGFGASDCRCDGHLVHFPEETPVGMPGELWRGDGVRGRFVERPNRFVLRVELPGEGVVDAYLPNTSRLTELLVDGAEVLVEPVDDPSRKTDYTVKRIRRPGQDSWVALVAVGAEDLMSDWLQRHGGLGSLEDIVGWERQVTLEGHRLDFRLERADGERVWLEVKSLSRAEGGEALLSKTPSKRGEQHLELLGDLVERGEPAMCSFVVQREDVERFRIGGDVDPGWLAAVERALGRGVPVVPLACRVTPSNIWVDGPLPVVT